MIQFIRMRRMYQLVFAVAVPATLLLYINESRTWFYGIGVFELVMLILAIVTVCIDHTRAKKRMPPRARPTRKQRHEACDSGLGNHDRP